QLGGARRIAADEGDRAILADVDVDPERRRGADAADVDAARRTVERLNPQRHAAAVVPADEQALPVRHPQRPGEIAIDAACRAATGTSGCAVERRDVNLVTVGAVAIARIPVGNPMTVRRERRVALE